MITLKPNPKPNRAQAVFERIVQTKFGILRGALGIAWDDNQRYANPEVQDLWELFLAGEL